jgi:hypothetical protein
MENSIRGDPCQEKSLGLGDEDGDERDCSRSGQSALAYVRGINILVL